MKEHEGGSAREQRVTGERGTSEGCKPTRLRMLAHLHNLQKQTFRIEFIFHFTSPLTKYPNSRRINAICFSPQNFWILWLLVLPALHHTTEYNREEVNTLLPPPILLHIHFPPECDLIYHNLTVEPHFFKSIFDLANIVTTPNSLRVTFLQWNAHWHAKFSRRQKLHRLSRITVSAKSTRRIYTSIFLTAADDA